MERFACRKAVVCNSSMCLALDHPVQCSLDPVWPTLWVSDQSASTGWLAVRHYWQLGASFGADQLLSSLKLRWGFLAALLGAAETGRSSMCKLLYLYSRVSS
jgi:hypothetical protein